MGPPGARHEVGLGLSVGGVEGDRLPCHAVILLLVVIFHVEGTTELGGARHRTAAHQPDTATSPERRIGPGLVSAYE